MADKSEYKTIRKKTQGLLDGSEDEEVEFKESTSSLDNQDLVAFANSPNGGYILIGIEEVEEDDNLQRGEVKGCTVTDENKRRILNRANSCRPPVDLNIAVENTNDDPFFRIYIPESEEKPHCTSGGRYKIRHNGEVDPIAPAKLLSMFARLESEEFTERFRDATDELTKELANTVMSSLRKLSVDIDGMLDDTEREIEEGLEEIKNDVSTMKVDINSHLKEIYTHSKDATDLSDDAMMLSDETLGKVGQLEQEIKNTKGKIDYLERKLDLLTTTLTDELEIKEEYEKLKLKRDAKSHLSRHFTGPIESDAQESKKEKMVDSLENWLKRLKFEDRISNKLVTYVQDNLENWCEEVIEKRKRLIDRVKGDINKTNNDES